jgi:hypothetical protein
MRDKSNTNKRGLKIFDSATRNFEGGLNDSRTLSNSSFRISKGASKNQSIFTKACDSEDSSLNGLGSSTSRVNRLVITQDGCKQIHRLRNNLDENSMLDDWFSKQKAVKFDKQKIFQKKLKKTSTLQIITPNDMSLKVSENNLSVTDFDGPRPFLAQKTPTNTLKIKRHIDSLIVSPAMNKLMPCFSINHDSGAGDQRAIWSWKLVNPSGKDQDSVIETSERSHSIKPNCAQGYHLNGGISIDNNLVTKKRDRNKLSNSIVGITNGRTRIRDSSNGDLTGGRRQNLSMNVVSRFDLDLEMNDSPKC